MFGGKITGLTDQGFSPFRRFRYGRSAFNCLCGFSFAFVYILILCIVKYDFMHIVIHELLYYTTTILHYITRITILELLELLYYYYYITLYYTQNQFLEVSVCKSVSQ